MQNFRDLLLCRKSFLRKYPGDQLTVSAFSGTINARAGLTERSGSTLGGEVPAIFIGGPMKELSIFVDESGDFGPYAKHSPYYLVTMVFHDQRKSIDKELQVLREKMAYTAYGADHCFHAMPIIRRESDYRMLDLDERRKLMGALLGFVRKTNISYHTFFVEKSPGITSLDISAMLSKQISTFFTQYSNFFREYDKIVVYYDYGQHELATILVAMFTILFPNPDFRHVQPSEYRLFQVADLFCSLELIKHKYKAKELSSSESTFFITEAQFNRDYLRLMSSKHISSLSKKI